MKKKGLQENMTIRTIPDLLARVEAEYQRRRKEIATRQAASKQTLQDRLEEEKLLVSQLEMARTVIKGMKKEFSKIEHGIEKEKRREIESSAIREKDVTSGRIKLKQFQEQGISEKKITEKVIAESSAELEDSLIAIRAKNLEILTLEESLGRCQNTIRGLVVQSGTSMIEVLKNLKEFTEQETGEFIAELESLRSSWKQTQEKILLTQGKSYSGRHAWRNLSLEEARSLQFDGILPFAKIRELKNKLVEFKKKDVITVVYYFKSGSIDVSTVTGRRGLLQTGQLREDKDEKFKREKTKY